MRTLVKWAHSFMSWFYDTRAFHVVVGVIAYHYWGVLGVVCVLAVPFMYYFGTMAVAIVYILTHKEKESRHDIDDEEWLNALVVN